jgi:protein-tyrosine phosphatase
VLDYGVRTVVDLRGPSEARAGSRPFPSAAGSRVTYVNTPLYDERDAATMRALLECESAKQTYEVLLSESGPAIAGAAQAVARAPRGAVVVHCQIGRDRTGLLSALLLSLVGVPAPAIIADYALSRPALEPLFGRWLTQARTEQEHRAIERARRCEPDAMQATLDLLDERYAGSVGFLRDAGLEDDDREALVARLSPA